MNKKAFLILGEANSGNRMMRLAFMSSGCYGDPVKGIQIDDLRRGGLPDKIVIARSGPNGNIVPDFKELAKECIQADYKVVPIMIYRKTDFALFGHCGNYNITHEKALEYRNVITYLAYELSEFLKTPLIVIIYEQFVLHSFVREFLFKSLGLNPPTMDFYNANEKYNLPGPPLPY